MHKTLSPSTQLPPFSYPTSATQKRTTHPSAPKPSHTSSNTPPPPPYTSQTAPYSTPLQPSSSPSPPLPLALHSSLPPHHPPSPHPTVPENTTTDYKCASPNTHTASSPNSLRRGLWVRGSGGHRRSSAASDCRSCCRRRRGTRRSILTFGRGWHVRVGRRRSRWRIIACSLLPGRRYHRGLRWRWKRLSLRRGTRVCRNGM